MVAPLTLAVTGATGFVGSRLRAAARAAGHRVRALTRRDQPAEDGIEWLRGDLGDADALFRLADGVDAIIHVAGVINAPGEAGFVAGNVTGTEAMLRAAEAGGARRFVHVSSLAAREPELSLYGKSKAQSERLFDGLALPHAIVRPPAVYGPGDRETLELFRMAKRRLILLPPDGRLSLVHADDLSALLLRLAAPDAPSGLTIEPDDGRPGGWTHKEFGQALGEAVGTRPLAIAAPRGLLRLGATADRLVRRDAAKLTHDRVAYFCHPDWVVDPARRAPEALWTPAIDTRTGLTATADWYRRAGWL